MWNISYILLTTLVFSRVHSFCVPENSTIFAESFIANSKCLQVLNNEPESKLSLNDCLYKDKLSLSKNQQLRIIANSIGQSMLKTRGGNCLTTSTSGTLKTTFCDAKDTRQSWNLKSVKGAHHQFLIQQFYTGKCLVLKSLTRGSEIELSTCNFNISNQIWKLHYTSSGNPAVLPLITC